MGRLADAFGITMDELIGRNKNDRGLNAKT
jgi:hypothetical protein